MANGIADASRVIAACRAVAAAADTSLLCECSGFTKPGVKGPGQAILVVPAACLFAPHSRQPVEKDAPLKNFADLFANFDCNLEVSGHAAAD